MRGSIGHRIGTVLGVLLCLAPPVFAAGAKLGRSGPIDEPPIVGGFWCPKPALQFVADGSEATIQLVVTNFGHGEWKAHGFDNVSIVPLAVYNAYQAMGDHCGNCVAPTLDFQAVPPASIVFHDGMDDLQDPNWKLGYGAYYVPEDLGSGAAAQHDVAVSCPPWSGGALWLGEQVSPDEYASTHLTVTGLTPGTTYVLTYYHRAKTDGVHWVDVFGRDFTSPYVCNFDEFAPAGLKTLDHFGTAVGVSGNIAAVGAPGVGDDDEGAVFVYRNFSGLWYEEATLTEDFLFPEDAFGTSVAADADSGLVVVGVPLSEEAGADAGAVFVYRYVAHEWTLDGVLLASTPDASDRFGASVAVRGNLLAVGAPGDDDKGTDAGAVYLCTYNGSGWFTASKLLAVDGAAGDELGTSIGLDVTAIAAGAPLADVAGETDAGAVYVFDQGFGGTWGQVQKLTANDHLASDADADDDFGRSVTLDGARLAAGAPGDDMAAADAGAVYVYENTGSWTPDGKITAADATASDAFGSAVSVDADALLVGNPGDDDVASDTGSIYVFTRNGNWSLYDELHAGAPSASDGFGAAVGLSGPLAVTGSPDVTGDGGETERGSAWQFMLFGEDCDLNGIDDVCELAASAPDLDDDGVLDVCVAPNLPWELTKLVASDPAVNENFGDRFAVDGTIAVVGVPTHDHPGLDQGAAYAMQFDGQTWNTTELLAFDGEAGDRFGEAVDVDGDVILVGATGDDDGGVDAGAVYVYRLVSGNWTFEQKLTASDAAAGMLFGGAVAVEADRAVAGASVEITPGNRRARFYAFEKSGSWSESQMEVTTSQTSNEYATYALSLDGGTLMVGIPWNNSNEGLVAFYEDLGGWTLVDTVKPAGAAPGDRFGHAVDVRGTVAIAGAPWEDSGAAYVYREVLSWLPEVRLTPDDTMWLDRFGTSVSIDGAWCVVGSPARWRHARLGGALYLYGFDANSFTWPQTGVLWPQDLFAADRLGQRVVVQGDVAFAATPMDDDGGLASGSVRLFGLGDDCNTNGTPDGLDILAGTSLDANTNGIPDECEPVAVDPGLPSRARLHAAAPNPFNPVTNLRFEVPAGAHQVRLMIVDTSGRRVRTLVDAPLSPGPHSVAWRGDDGAGRAVASGIYFAVLETGATPLTRKLVLLK